MDGSGNKTSVDTYDSDFTLEEIKEQSEAHMKELEETNIQRLQRMTVEELADFLERTTDEERDDWFPLGCNSCIYQGTHHEPEECVDCSWKNGITGWLRAKASETN